MGHLIIMHLNFVAGSRKGHHPNGIVTSWIAIIYKQKAIQFR
jgi:hypothetical protein